MKSLKKIIAVVVLLFILAISPNVMNAEPVMNDGITSTSQSEMSEVKFIVKGFNVRIINAARMNMQVYSLTGACVATYHIDSDDHSFNLALPKGIYILKVGDVARKISLR